MQPLNNSRLVSSGENPVSSGRTMQINRIKSEDLVNIMSTIKGTWQSLGESLGIQEDRLKVLFSKFAPDNRDGNPDFISQFLKTWKQSELDKGSGLDLSDLARACRKEEEHNTHDICYRLENKYKLSTTDENGGKGHVFYLAAIVFPSVTEYETTDDEAKTTGITATKTEDRDVRPADVVQSVKRLLRGLEAFGSTQPALKKPKLTSVDWLADPDK